MTPRQAAILRAVTVEFWLSVRHMQRVAGQMLSSVSPLAVMALYPRPSAQTITVKFCA